MYEPTHPAYPPTWKTGLLEVIAGRTSSFVFAANPRTVVAAPPLTPNTPPVRTVDLPVFCRASCTTTTMFDKYNNGWLKATTMVDNNKTNNGFTITTTMVDNTNEG